MAGQLTGTQTLQTSETQTFAQWFSVLLKRLFGNGSGPAASEPTLSRENESSEEEGDFVIAPGGYRIRVPKPHDMNQTVGEALPEVREGLNLLPPLPTVILELLREIQNPNSTASSVANIAANDPSLAASLLRTVNGATSGLTRKVTSVAEAVSYLGFGVVRSLVVQLRLEQVMPVRNAASAIESEDLWVHSLAVSYIADALADRIGDVDRGFVATLGLLHDIGRLAIVAQFPDRIAALRNAPASGDPNESRMDRERRAFGADHAVLGATLGLRWKLPADLTQAIRWHHHPERAFEAQDPLPMRKAVCLIQIADQLAKYCFAYSTDMEIEMPPQQTFDLLGLPASIPRLLDARIRAAAAKAILFADESSKRPATAVRPFLKLTMPADGPLAVRRLNPAAQGPSRLSVGDRGIALFDEHPQVCRHGHSAKAIAHESPRLLAPATGEGIDWLSKALIAQWDAQSVPARQYAPMRTTLRALLANLAVPKGEIEIVHRYADGRLEVAVRSNELSFARRIVHESPEVGPRLLEAELGNILNLGWFDIETSADGSVLSLKNR
jgi:putative nucleotidyltransferase with HDIG domain